MPATHSSEPRRRRARTYVALGDSLTVGTGDVLPDGRLRGFADVLATTLPPGSRYANLARTSVRVDEVARDQVPSAVRMRPDLVTVVAGVNDVIALRFDAGRVAEWMDHVFAALRRGLPSAGIATAVLPDLRAHSRVARLGARRVAALNDGVLLAAARRDVLVVRLDAIAVARHDLAVDRMHPSAGGHQQIAAAFCGLLGLPQPARPPTPPPQAEAPAGSWHRLRRTVAVTPRFLARRIDRARLIAAQQPKLPRPVAIGEQTLSDAASSPIAGSGG